MKLFFEVYKKAVVFTQAAIEVKVQLFYFNLKKQWYIGVTLILIILKFIIWITSVCVFQYCHHCGFAESVVNVISITLLCTITCDTSAGKNLPFSAPFALIDARGKRNWNNTAVDISTHSVLDWGRDYNFFLNCESK